ncbi:hypothetical protein J1N35_044549 [Gossypium stocksii]|uniref:Uncharacterized protein n=1 Tax=Gossypium stocksii TaxID=47602 RepID=A0A9D3ZG27_9ROSI|nr:hypothetical protein J1N35_044549 [Gossypium stocksii]
MLAIFQHQYQLKGSDVGKFVRFYYFSYRSNRGYNNNSSETDNISRELNGAMNINFLSGRKKYKISTGTVCINPLNEESNTQLEHHQKRNLLVRLLKSPRLTLPLWQACHRLPRLAHQSQLMKIIFTLFLGVLFLPPLLKKYLSRLLEKKKLYLEKDSTLVDAVPSVVDDDTNIVPSVAGGDETMVLSVVGSFALDITARSFSLANCFGGCCSLPTSLDITVGSFALTNYFGGRDSLPASFDITAGSFTLANYFGCHNSLHASLDFTTESFALTNCFKGGGSLLASLDITAGSFALINCFGSYGSSSTSLDITIGSFALTNYFGGYGSSPVSINLTTKSFAR